MTYTSPTPASDSRQRGRLRASLRTGTITLTGSTGTVALAFDVSISDFVAIKSIPSAGRRSYHISRIAGIGTPNRSRKIVEGRLIDEDAAPRLRPPDGPKRRLHRFCSHQCFNTNRDHGRDHEVSPARKRFHTSRTAPAQI